MSFQYWMALLVRRGGLSQRFIPYPELAVSQRRAAAVRGANGVEGYNHHHFSNGYRHFLV
ncbi:hypothetical protein JW960_05035 [candidate division KSB1 bacterium]|nr:hypothetical protein [candidate division KSB1 bacterium]